MTRFLDANRFPLLLDANRFPLRLKTLWRLFLEELVCRDGDGHFPRFRVNQIGQRENHAIDDAADHGDDRQKEEQAGHTRASGGELTIEIMWDGLTRLPTCSLPCW